MKKTTKTTKSRTPATPTETTAAKPAARGQGAPRLVKPAAAAAPSAPASPAAPAAPVIAATVIIADKDVGFGNTLYIRGSGPGLSWTKGVALACEAADRWTFALAGATRPVEFKFLLNDETWSTGANLIAAPGSRGIFSPLF